MDGIRIMADANLTGTNRWRVCELGLYMEQPDPAAQADTPTPTITPTPSVTPTPSSTPTSTPNYYVEITSTSGAPMRFERGADAGDYYIFIGLMIIALILIIGFSALFWQRRNNGS